MVLSNIIQNQIRFLPFHYTLPRLIVQDNIRIQKTKTAKCLLTTSCTHALEMAALLADIQPGDEVIMPSYTFVSTARQQWPWFSP